MPRSGAPTSPLLIVTGYDGEVVPNQKGGFRAGGACDLYKLLPEGLPFDQVNLASRFMARQKPTDPSLYPCIINLVTDADQHPQTLGRIREMLAGYRGRVINPPEAVLESTRETVAQNLTGVSGLRVPKAIRLAGGDPGAAAEAVERAGLGFPLILRRAGTHTGQIVGVVNRLEELQAAVSSQGDFLAIEFVELRGADGLYRKYRVYFFGRRVVYRNLYFSGQWNVHAKDHRKTLAERPELLKELQAMFTRPEGAFPDHVLKLFGEVRERMPLDYFGMDFGFAPDGEAVLFEANASMSFVPHWPDAQFRYSLKPAMEALRVMLAEAITGRSPRHRNATGAVKN